MMTAQAATAATVTTVPYITVTMKFTSPTL